MFGIIIKASEDSYKIFGTQQSLNNNNVSKITSRNAYTEIHNKKIIQKKIFNNFESFKNTSFKNTSLLRTPELRTLELRTLELKTPEKNNKSKEIVITPSKESSNLISNLISNGQTQQNPKNNKFSAYLKKLEAPVSLSSSSSTKDFKMEKEISYKNSLKNITSLMKTSLLRTPEKNRESKEIIITPSKESLNLISNLISNEKIQQNPKSNKFSAYLKKLEAPVFLGSSSSTKDFNSQNINKIEERNFNRDSSSTSILKKSYAPYLQKNTQPSFERLRSISILNKAESPKIKNPNLLQSKNHYQFSDKFWNVHENITNHPQKNPVQKTSVQKKYNSKFIDLNDNHNYVNLFFTPRNIEPSKKSNIVSQKEKDRSISNFEKESKIRTFTEKDRESINISYENFLKNLKKTSNRNNNNYIKSGMRERNFITQNY